jgi:hypothetical protein
MLKILNMEKRNNMENLDFRKPDMDNLIQKSYSDFCKERYENHVSLMNRVHKKVNESMENVRSRFRVEVIERYMEWLEGWFTSINEQESDIVLMTFGDTLRTARDYMNGKGELVEKNTEILSKMIEEKSKEYDY